MIVHNNFPLSPILYYRIGGIARYVLEVNSAVDIEEAISFLYEKKILKKLIIGYGSNVLVSDDFFDGAVIWIKEGSNSTLEKIGEKEITSYAGNLVDNLINFSFAQNLVGLEWAGGLPSSVGGAVRGNAGAFGGDVAQNILAVRAIELLEDNFLIRDFSSDQCNFSYRNSIFKQQKNLIITQATFKLENAGIEVLAKTKEEYSSHILYRQTHHPVEYPSCGSVFKNITQKKDIEKMLFVWPEIREQVNEKWHGKVSMGYVIKRLGLESLKIGGAAVSEKHSNYIVNKNHAKFSDVLGIINKIKEEFSHTFGFFPETEVEIVS